MAEQEAGRVKWSRLQSQVRPGCGHDRPAVRQAAASALHGHHVDTPQRLFRQSPQMRRSSSQPSPWLKDAPSLLIGQTVLATHSQDQFMGEDRPEEEEGWILLLRFFSAQGPHVEMAVGLSGRPLPSGPLSVLLVCLCLGQREPPRVPTATCSLFSLCNARCARHPTPPCVGLCARPRRGEPGDSCLRKRVLTQTLEAAGK